MKQSSAALDDTLVYTKVRVSICLENRKFVVVCRKKTTAKMSRVIKKEKKDDEEKRATTV
jgi:hypothetical protein